MLRKIFKWALIVVAVLFILSLLGEDNTTNKDVDTSVITYESPETLDPQPRGKRTLGIGISDGSIGFNAAFMIAKEAGAEVVEIPTFWDEIETSPGAFSGGWLPVADAFYPQSNTKISISLNAVDTNKLRLPDDLKDRPFNDPEVIKRYKEFVSFAATQVPNSEVYFVSVGNEVDIYLGNSNKKWQEYSEFFSAVAPHVRKEFGGAAVGVKMSYHTLIDLPENGKSIIEVSDVILANYYPFQPESYLMHQPATVYADFKKITEMYPAKKVYFSEIGYPSSKINGSSELQQALFIKHTFAAWDMYSDQIPFLNFIWLHDISDKDSAGYQEYYGSKNKGFTSYLETLGLRTFDGSDKEAFIELKRAVRERGW